MLRVGSVQIQMEISIKRLKIVYTYPIKHEKQVYTPENQVYTPENQVYTPENHIHELVKLCSIIFNCIEIANSEIIVVSCVASVQMQIEI